MPKKGLRVGQKVDDNPVSREILAGLLASFGFDVTRAESGSEALAILGAAATARSFRLVLLDWRMPAMDGIETAARIRSNETTQVPEIMMVSAFGRDEVIRRAQEVGIKAFLTKPVHASLLLETIQGLLGGTVRASEPSEPLAAAAAAAESLRGARVLLVEDNRLNQEIAGALLRKVGVEVEIVDDGREAVEAFRRTPLVKLSRMP